MFENNVEIRKNCSVKPEYYPTPEEYTKLLDQATDLFYKAMEESKELGDSEPSEIEFDLSRKLFDLSTGLEIYYPPAEGMCLFVRGVLYSNFWSQLTSKMWDSLETAMSQLKTPESVTYEQRDNLKREFREYGVLDNILLTQKVTNA